jgi:hypothetical protein
MKDKTQRLLEEAYRKVLVKEDTQDETEDSKLRYMLNAYLSNTLEREEFTQYNLPKIVDRIFEMLQGHTKKTYEAGRAKGYEEGLEAFPEMDAMYRQEEGL